MMGDKEMGSNPNNKSKVKFKPWDFVFLPTPSGILSEAIKLGVKKYTGKTPLGWAYHGVKVTEKSMNVLSLYDRGLRTAKDYDWHTCYKNIPGYKRNPYGIWYDEQAAHDLKKGVCSEATNRIYPPEHLKNKIVYVKESDEGVDYQSFAEHRQYMNNTADERERALTKTQYESFLRKTSASAKNATTDKMDSKKTLGNLSRSSSVMTELFGPRQSMALGASFSTSKQTTSRLSAASTQSSPFKPFENTCRPKTFMDEHGAFPQSMAPKASFSTIKQPMSRASTAYRTK